MILNIYIMYLALHVPSVMGASNRKLVMGKTFNLGTIYRSCKDPPAETKIETPPLVYANACARMDVIKRYENGKGPTR